MSNTMLHKARRIYIIGIGGIGASALARWLKSEGLSVGGSDAVSSETTNQLEKDGIDIYIGHKKENLNAVFPDLVVASLAIPRDNPEMIAARDNKITVLTYPEALGELIENLDVIAVAGTNGKSTTTALLGFILKEAGIDPVILVGSIIPEIQSNFYKGSSKTAVIEACEYKRAFLNYKPALAIITNIEADHLDYYKSIDDIIGAFADFTLNIKEKGALIINGDDANCEKAAAITAAKRSDIKIIRFGKNKNCDFQFSNILVKSEKVFFKLKEKDETANEFYLQIPGEFNVYNAAAAYAASRIMGAKIDLVKKTLRSFKGIRRRFEMIGAFKDVPVISDYAHHPTAVFKTIEAAHSFFPKKRVLAVFQPHQHNRTRELFDDFVKCFDEADVLILCEIYAVKGRISEEDKKVSSSDLVRVIKDRDGERGVSREILFAPDLKQAEKLIRAHARKNDCILIMGAGDIGEMPEKLVTK